MKKNSQVLSIFLVVCFAIMLTTVDNAWSSDRTLKKGAQLSPLLKTTGQPVSTMININNVAGWIRNDGWSARNPSTGNAGVYFPRGTTTAIFQDGIVWGGNVNDGGTQVLRVGGQTYSIGTQGGKILSKGVAADPNGDDVRVYRIRRDYKTADLRQDASELLSKGLTAVSDGDIAAVRAQYEKDWNEWPATQGAPYYDRNGNGAWDPGVDEPGVADADQVIWFVCNDLNAGKTNALYGSNPIGMELQVTLWGYNRTDPLANVYFKKFTFIYKGTATSQTGSTISDMYVGQWSDPDMGDAGDDFSGCDTTLSLGYVYNGSSVDAEYAKFGLKPPAVGYDFLQGPMVNGAPTDSAVFGLQRRYGKKNLPMTAAFYFAAGGTYSDPPFSYDGTKQWYNLLRGLTPITGSPFIHPATPGEATKFWLDGDPTKGTGRVDGAVDNPGDRRLGVCAGPFSMALGDTQEIVVGVVAGIGADYLNSIAVMKNNDVAVQSAYDNLFVLPKAPPQAGVKVVALDKQIVLDWGSDAKSVDETETFDKQGYTFQGYNVYQLPTASSSLDQAVPLATYDKEGDGVRTVTDTIFDAGLGTFTIIIKQKGTDSGIRRKFVVNTDKVRSAPLVNGQSYYFAVTTYGYNPSSQALTHALESSLQILTAIPKSADPGTRYYAAVGDTIKITNTNPGKKSDGAVIATVVDPTKLTGKSYKVTFKDVDSTYSFASGDVTNPLLRWFVTSGPDTIQRGFNQGPTVTVNPGDGDQVGPKNGNEFNYPIVDGFLITVSGPPPLLSEDRSKITGTRWWGSLSGTAVGGFILGGAGTAKLRNTVTTSFDMTNYLGAVGSTLSASDYVDVEIRWGANGSLTQKAYSYSRGAIPGGESGSGYKYTGYFDVPFQVWDVSGTTPRQLNVGWRDNNANNVWDPNSDLEVIFIAKSTYDGNTPASYGTSVGFSTNNLVRKDVMYCAQFITSLGGAGVEGITSTVVTVSPNYVNATSDVFTFTAPKAPSYDAATAKADVSAINVFPNPYYGFNRAETSRFQRFVTFNHMPRKAEVRIFNIAGALVKALRKDDGSQFMNWDLTNTSNLPVASGLYIAHMQLKDAAGADLGTKILKLVVIQEQQYLDNY